MYVHLGGDLVVAVTDVVAVLDGRLIAVSEVTEEFVRRAGNAGRIRGEEPARTDRPERGERPARRPGAAESKSLVVTRDGTVFLSGISPATLTRRMTHLRQSAKFWDAKT